MSENYEIDIGTKVYHRCAQERMPGIVVGIWTRAKGRTLEVGWGNRTSSWHADTELSTTYVPNFKDET